MRDVVLLATCLITHLNAKRHVAINKTSHRRTHRHETQTIVILTPVYDVCERTHRHPTQTHERRCLQVQFDSRTHPMSITHTHRAAASTCGYHQCWWKCWASLCRQLKGNPQPTSDERAHCAARLPSSFGRASASVLSCGTHSSGLFSKCRASARQPRVGCWRFPRECPV